MKAGISVVGVYVDDQDEALAFYVDKLGFRVHTDVRNGPYRWLTVQHPDQPGFQLGLFAPGPPLHDEATAQTLRAMVAKGAMPALVLSVADCRASYAQLKTRGVEFTQEPVERFGSVDAGFRDPAGRAFAVSQRPDFSWSDAVRISSSRAARAAAVSGRSRDWQITHSMRSPRSGLADT
jgi:catechol 2,3-dioxygenase-like lactoylglutathione lyase family enzyme